MTDMFDKSLIKNGLFECALFAIGKKEDGSEKDGLMVNLQKIIRMAAKKVREIYILKEDHHTVNVSLIEFC